ncbi:MAG: NADH-ubiquinone oxidoreductase-F iron-sulfur binding region domain-containing protein [Myxococcota bacterium]
MSLLSQFRCCEKCNHSLETPCRDRILCLAGKISCHDDSSCSQLRQENLRIIRNETGEDKVIYIGYGTCGLGAGAEETRQQIEKWLTNNNHKDCKLIKVGCVGLCSGEPLVDIQLPGKERLSFAKVQAEEVAELLDKVFSGDIPKARVLGRFPNEILESWNKVDNFFAHAFFAGQTRVVLENCGIVDPMSVDSYIARGGYQALSKVLNSSTQVELCDEIEASGLRGRGGGGFPTGRKWKFAYLESSRQKYIICNADEGDPGAFMDRAIIEGDPHRVLEGLLIAAYAIGASDGYIYIRSEYPLAICRLEKAIEEAQEHGLLGSNILNSQINIKVKLKKGAGAFVCGEETALMHSIEGKRGMPRPRPPYPAVKGLFNRPTLINNVETLATVPWIVARGAESFRKLGTENSKGTKIFALSGDINRAGLVEVEMGTSIRSVVETIGGGVSCGREYKAAQIGGPSGGCIPAKFIDTSIDYESLKKVGAMMGSGGLVIMDDKKCMVDVAKYFMEFIRRESCGKCIPCREGTRRVLQILKMITGEEDEDESLNNPLERMQAIVSLRKLARVIKDTSLCGLGQTAANPVISTLEYFRDEYEEHIFEGKCSTGVCSALVEYRIDVDKCTGCTLCARECPAGAIKGARKAPHYIVDSQCIKCGVCLEVCRFEAVNLITE